MTTRTPTFSPGDRVIAPACLGTACRCGQPGGPGRVVAIPTEWAPMVAVHLDDDPDGVMAVFVPEALRREPTI